MSKVYSLLLPDFIIYDSRVASALAWFVATWCQQLKPALSSVPSLLCFPCLRPKEAEDARLRKLRNPSCSPYQFPWLYSAANPAKHAQWNLRASWILEDALARATKAALPRVESPDGAPPISPFHGNVHPMRALEAALFMWGYDLSLSAPCLGGYGGAVADRVDEDEEKAEVDIVPVGNAPENHSTAMQNAEMALMHQSKTRGGKARIFHWSFDSSADRLVIARTGLRNQYFSPSAIFRVIYELFDVFGYDWFPLANNVVKLGIRKEQPGLGMTIIGDDLHSGKIPSPETISHAQSASQLGVIMQRVGLFEGDGAIKGIRWRLTTELPEDIDELRMLLASPEWST